MLRFGRSRFLLPVLLTGACGVVGTQPQNPGSGGAARTGGVGSSTGGKAHTGGTVATGGSTVPRTPPSANCTDVSSYTNRVVSQYGKTNIRVEGGTKNYIFGANWWNMTAQAFTSAPKTIDQDGIGFKVNNPYSGASTDNSPLGFPTIFIGTYSGSATDLSNLPKAVSSLSNVYTVFKTNANSKGRHDYNAAYDVWFTATGTPLARDASSPGAGGAYLMVWYFMPDNRQPRGSLRDPDKRRTVQGVSGSWDVWYDTTNPPCISYVSSTPIEELDFDLNNFIQDSITNNYGLKSSMYLSVVFAGFEIWGGADGIEAKAFCVDVK